MNCRGSRPARIGPWQPDPGLPAVHQFKICTSVPVQPAPRASPPHHPCGLTCLRSCGPTFRAAAAPTAPNGRRRTLTRPLRRPRSCPPTLPTTTRWGAAGGARQAPCLRWRSCCPCRTLCVEGCTGCLHRIAGRGRFRAYGASLGGLVDAGRGSDQARLPLPTALQLALYGLFKQVRWQQSGGGLLQPRAVWDQCLLS